MSAAMSSTLNISFDIRGGLLIRQIHHWAALLFVASIGLHMLRIFFTGAFRKPREINWVVGFMLFVLAMLEGFTGYSLPDDLLSGNGLRIIDGLVKGIPIVGTWISYLVFGGEFPGNADRRTPVLRVHILLGPAILLVAALGVHLVLLVVNKHTQFAGPGRTERQRRRRADHPGVRGEGRWILLHRLRRDRPDRRRSSRSTRSGRTARTTPRRSRRGRSRTGTSDSRTARCVWCHRTGSSCSGASRSR